MKIASAGLYGSLKPSPLASTPYCGPLRGQELHPALGAGAGDAQVAAVVGLDLVDRREHLPGDPVGRAGGLVDRQQERRHLEAFDEEARHARDRRSERQRQRRRQRRRRGRAMRSRRRRRGGAPVRFGLLVRRLAPPVAPCDFACAWAAVAEPPAVLPCACWARTCGVAASLGAPDGGAGAGRPGRFPSWSSPGSLPAWWRELRERGWSRSFRSAASFRRAVVVPVEDGGCRRFAGARRRRREREREPAPRAASRSPGADGARRSVAVRSAAGRRSRGGRMGVVGRVVIVYGSISCRAGS